MSSGKLFQTACDKARSAKARLVRSSCSRFLPSSPEPAGWPHIPNFKVCGGDEGEGRAGKERTGGG